ncbi:MAG: hypothetical protein H6822_23695 [Planctomycetaceae bacterium]|nr:hypothetical protein [Planctomycetales bacterium]MCB9925203.1 hypothetical protein [Planctomycetaceae bacterium]
MKPTIFFADSRQEVLVADQQTDVHFVRLERLPNVPGTSEVLQLPDLLRDRIWFDEVQRRLVFRGFMSKATFDQLHSLSNDSVYLRAIGELFQVCVFEEPARKTRSLSKLLPIAAIAAAALLIAVLALPLRLLTVR